MFRFGMPAKGAAALLSLALASTGAHAGTTPNGLSFAVKVSTNSGAPFNDCFTFGADGRLVVSGLRRYGSLVYADDTYGTDVTWLSVAPPGFVARFGAAYTFTGEVDNGDLVATGLSTPDYTYSITGTPTASCAADAAFGPKGWTAGR
jgi:hypothetical protein